jgi:DNA-binding protein
MTIAKKKIIAAVMSLAILSGGFAAGTCGSLSEKAISASITANAEVYYGYSDFSFDSDTNTLLSYIGEGGDVVIPQYINGSPVEYIADGCFEFTDITSVTIPDTVKSIESYAFYGCDNLKSIAIPYGVEYIGSMAIGYNSENTVPDSFTIYYYSGTEGETYAKDWLENVDTSRNPSIKQLYVNMSDTTVSGVSDKTYTGGKVGQASTIYVSYGGRELTLNKDYTISYPDDIVNVGDVYVKITGKGAFKGSVTEYYSILPKQANTLKATYTKSYVYTGGAIKPEITLKCGSKTLVSGTDYTVSYDGGNAVGSHTITVTGKGNFTGTATYTYKITAASIAKATVKIAACTYSGKSQTPTPTVKVGGKTLKKGTDYTVSYSSNVNAGTAKAVIKGKGNYTGSVTKTFKIKQKTVKKITVSKISAKTYTGSKIVPAITVKADGKTLKKNTDYTYTVKNNTAPGTATVTVKLGKNYTGKKTATASFKIKLGKVSGVKTTAVSTSSVKISWKKLGKAKYKVYRYNAKTKKYTLLGTTSSTSYKDTKLSQATVYTYRVKPVYGKYSGTSVTVKGNTNVAAPTLSLKTYSKKATLNWSKNSKADGYQIYWCKGDTTTVPKNNYYSLKDVVCTDYWWSSGEFSKLKTLTKASAVTFTKTGLSASKNYHFKVRAYKKMNGKTYYSDWSDTQATINSVNRLNAAKLTSRSSYQVINKQTANHTVTTHTLSSEEISILKKFADSHFKKGWTAGEKIEYTAEWIRNNMVYGNIPTASHTKNIFVYKEGQCSDYNGAIVEMMTYLGYNAQLIQGYTNKGGQHFWGEVIIDGTTYVMEVGEKRSDNPTWNYKWEFICMRYSETNDGYVWY